MLQSATCADVDGAQSGTAGHTCPANFQNKPSRDTIVIDGLTDAAKDAACCDPVCSLLRLVQGAAEHLQAVPSCLACGQHLPGCALVLDLYYYSFIGDLQACRCLDRLLLMLHIGQVCCTACQLPPVAFVLVICLLVWLMLLWPCSSHHNMIVVLYTI